MITNTSRFTLVNIYNHQQSNPFNSKWIQTPEDSAFERNADNSSTHLTVVAPAIEAGVVVTGVECLQQVRRGNWADLRIQVQGSTHGQRGAPELKESTHTQQRVQTYLHLFTVKLLIFVRGLVLCISLAGKSMNLRSQWNTHSL